MAMVTVTVTAATTRKARQLEGRAAPKFVRRGIQSSLMRRLLIIAATGFLSLLAAYDAALEYWRDRAEDSGVSLLDARPLRQVLLTDRKLGSPEELAARSAGIRENARDALIANPLGAEAMRHMGMTTLLRDVDFGQAQLRVAERISRRDLATQLMLIDLTARTGNVAATLDHYNRALAVHPGARATLFPILDQAIIEPEIRQGLVRLAARPWLTTFLTSIAARSAEPGNVAALYLQVRQQLAPRERDRIAAAILDRLAATQHFSAATEFLQRLPDDLRRGSSDIGFSSLSTDPRLGRFGWQLTSGNDLEAVLQGRGGLAVRVASERAAQVASRISLLEPGSYDLAVVVGRDAGSPVARLSWKVSCLSGSMPDPLLNVILPEAQNTTRYRITLTIPQGCPAQTWILSAIADTTQFESVARIESMSLARQ